MRWRILNRSIQTAATVTLLILYLMQNPRVQQKSAGRSRSDCWPRPPPRVRGYPQLTLHESRLAGNVPHKSHFHRSESLTLASKTISTRACSSQRVPLSTRMFGLCLMDPLFTLAHSDFGLRDTSPERRVGMVSHCPWGALDLVGGMCFWSRDPILDFCLMKPHLEHKLTWA